MCNKIMTMNVVLLGFAFFSEQRFEKVRFCLTNLVLLGKVLFLGWPKETDTNID